MCKNLNFRALLEGAYAQSTTLPGGYVKFEELRNTFNALAAGKTEITPDFEKLLRESFPDAQYFDTYKPEGSDDVFKVVRIPSTSFTYIKQIKSKIEYAVRSLNTADDGFGNFAAVGLRVPKDLWQSMGFIGIRNAVEVLFGPRYEFRQGDPDKHEAPVQIRDKKKTESFVATTVQRVSRAALRPRQGSYLGTALDAFAYFRKPKGSVNILGWDAAINELAVNHALQEYWYFDPADQQKKPILKNYISYTFERLQYEDELESVAAAKENRRPRLKILTNENNAVWNTGLVDNIYDPIYAFFQKNDGSNPGVTQPWIFTAFDTANSYYQKIITDFPYKPERACYFTNPREIIYDVTATRPTLNWDHFIKANINRLPLGFIKKGATEGFEFIEHPEDLPIAENEAYFQRLTSAIYADDDWLQFLTTRFRNALDVALARVEWNYKTAIPVYYRDERKLQLLLPLALEKKDTIDVALVCNHKYDKEAGVNNYEGRTIFTIEMAYNNARLITRPDSDWLTAGKIAGNK